MSLRIWHIVGDSKYGGGAKIITELAGAAVAHGARVEVLTSDQEFQAAVRQVGAGVIAADCIRREIHPWRDLRGLNQLTRLLARERPDLVHTHTTKAGFVGRIAAQRAGIAHIVHTVHGFAFHEQSPALFVRTYAALERFAARRCHCLVTVSEYHRDWARRLGLADERRTRLVAIRNGIAPPATSAEFDRGALRAALGVPERGILVVSHGRLAAGKGLEGLLRALPSLQRELGGRVVIALVGDGPQRRRYEALARSLGIAEAVVFTGFRRDIADCLTAADVVVLPSFREGLSIALLEAMALGRPLVASAIGSNREVTCDGQAALLVRPGCVEDIRAAILQVVGDPEGAARRARRGREIFRDAFTIDRMLEEYWQLYREVIADGHNVRA